MNQLMCGIANVLYYAVYAYTAVLLIYAIVSWFPSLRGRWTNVLAALVEPVLIPIRRIIPPVGGLDLAFLIVLLVLQLLVRPALWSLANSCMFGS
ncbi:MAG: YggT family protein [Candidatus Cybelea sp.]